MAVTRDLDYSFFSEFNYREIEQNYDPIYETLIEGGVVWMDIDFKTECGDQLWPLNTLYTGHNHFMVTQWTLCREGLIIVCPCIDSSHNDYICFPNGSYHETDTGEEQ